MIADVYDSEAGHNVRIPRAGLVVVRDDNGTPLIVVGSFGPAGAHKIARVGDDDFNQVLQSFGVDVKGVEVTFVRPEGPPSGARLLSKR